MRQDRKSKKRGVILDLDNTLIHYWDIGKFPLLRAVERAYSVASDVATNSLDEAKRLAIEEHKNKIKGGLFPLHDRLRRILGYPDEFPLYRQMITAEAFLEPFLENARKYEDTDHAINTLKSKGYRLAIMVTNLWGSPIDLWEDELKRWGLLVQTAA